MPMNTTLLTRPGPPAISPRASARAPSTTCSTISAVVMLRVSPAWPVAQNGQAMPQPACDDTHIVTRPGYRISTDSTSEPSSSRHSVLRVVPPSHSMSRTAVSSGGSSVGDQLVARAAGRSVISAGSVDQPGEVVVRQLLGPERGLAQLGDRRTPLLRVRSARCRGGFLARRGSSKTEEGRWSSPTDCRLAHRWFTDSHPRDPRHSTGSRRSEWPSSGPARSIQNELLERRNLGEPALAFRQTTNSRRPAAPRKPRRCPESTDLPELLRERGQQLLAVHAAEQHPTLRGVLDLQARLRDHPASIRDTLAATDLRVHVLALHGIAVRRMPYSSLCDRRWGSPDPNRHPSAVANSPYLSFRAAAAARATFR